MFFLFSSVLPADSGAEGISGYMEYALSRTASESRDATGVGSRTDTGNLLQRYNLTLDRRVYPTLRFLTGGLFEKSDTHGSVETGTTTENFDASATKLRPFVDLSLSTPPYQAGVSYSRSENRQKSLGSPSLALIRDQYSGTMGWTPDGFPSFRFLFLEADNHDGERVLQDSTTRTYQLTSQYRPLTPILLYYQGSLSEAQDRRNNIETRDVIHNGRIGYSDVWWNRRVSVGSDYHITYRETETRAGGSGEAAVPLLSQSGLSAIDDTPDQGALSLNPSLVDGDIHVGSGINLGLPPPGGDAQRRNIGLDFGVPRRVNTLFVWIDRELSAPVAASFSWDVYSSSDNLNWVLRQTVFPAVLDPFVPRFEIRILDLTARYVKVVVRPLAPTVPLAADFPTIQVTELEAALRRPAAEAGGRRVSVLHIYNFSARTRILDVPSLTHELTYSLTKATASPSRYTLGNGLSAAHQLSRNVSTTVRLTREDGEEEDKTRTAYIYYGSLQATPLPTLRHSLLLAGRNETVEGRSNRNLSLFLYNTAGLYKGIDVNAAVGGSRSVSETGQKTDTVQADAGATIVPNSKVMFSLTWSDKRDRIAGGDAPAERTVTARSMQADVAVYPVNTVYLFGSYRVEEPSGQPRRNTRNYSASWTPFPDGKLHLRFQYSETLRSETDGRDRVISPGLRLDLGRGSFFSLDYQNISARDNLQTSSSDIVSGNLRISF